MRFCLSEDGETVDALVWRQYGRHSGLLVERVLDANPGLAAAGPVLSAGVLVALPVFPDAIAVEVPRLWD